MRARVPAATPPRGPSLVDRPRLAELVGATEPGGVCVVCAAAGYGGTTLLRQVTAATADAVAWVRLGRGEDLWAETAHSLAEVLGHRVATRRRDVLAALDAGPPLWLVVDVDDPSHLAQDLEMLAESVPPRARLAVASHRDVLSGPVTAGRLIELSEPALAFTPDEAVQLLAGTDIESVDALWELTEGWAAALLAAVSPQAYDHGDVVAWLRTQGADRLFQPWFERLPPVHRDFFRDTAILDVLEVGACNATRDASDSATVLSELTRGHAHVREITSPGSGEEERVWRRHPLLTLFLRRGIHHDATFLPHHSRAAEYFRQRDDVPGTMRHLLAAGRHDDAGRYLREHEVNLFRTGREAATLEWYDRLPGEEHGATAMRWLRTGWGHALSGDLSEAMLTVSRLDALGPDELADLETRSEFEGDVRTLSAYLAAFRGDTVTMVAEAERALAALDGAMERDAAQLAHTLRIRGLQWSGERARAAALLDELAQRPFPSDLVRETTLAAVRARRLLDDGRVHAAYQVAGRAMQWLHARGVDPFGVRQSAVAGELAAAHLERGDLVEADRLLQALVDSQQRHQRVGDLVTTQISVARLRRVRGDVGAALRALREARLLLTQQSPGSPMQRLLDAAEARMRIDTGDAVRAERLVAVLPASPERSLLWSRLALLRGTDPRRRLMAVEPSTPRLAAEQHLLLAVAKRASDTRMAEGHLLRAAQIAVDHGQALLLADASPGLRATANDVAQRHGHDGLAWLLTVGREQAAAAGSASGSEAAAAAAAAVAAAAAAGPPLSPGELQLLTMLPTRDTMATMASRLGVSENTVKTRLQRLYRKLSAHSRNEAIAHARARGLIA